jgi:O-antigen biosynthesis protein WbqP
MIRLFDIFFAFSGITFGFPILILIFIFGFFDTGHPIFIQERLGRNKKPFMLVKFRTMKVDTKSTASHLVSTSSITKCGYFLRNTKLDELPQLWNVLKGDMSLVGPRPNLLNQIDLIEKRDSFGVYSVRPGITGLAQIQNIDMSTPELLARTDSEMIATLSLGKYFTYIFKTITGSGSGDAVKP